VITIDDIIKASDTLRKLMQDKWLSQDLFSIRWWGLVSFLVFSYVLCFKLLDKKRFVELLLFGSLMSVFSVVADVFLTSLNLFIYKTSIFPIKPSIFIYDITAMPLYYMVLYQHATDWKKYSIVATLASLFMGYVFTPLLVKLGYLQFIRWSNTKAFLTIIVIGFLTKAVISLILHTQKKSLNKC
jgi:hypothetical protein